MITGCLLRFNRRCQGDNMKFCPDDLPAVCGERKFYAGRLEWEAKKQMLAAKDAIRDLRLVI